MQQILVCTGLFLKSKWRVVSRHFVWIICEKKDGQGRGLGRNLALIPFDSAQGRLLRVGAQLVSPNKLLPERCR